MKKVNGYELGKGKLSFNFAQEEEKEILKSDIKMFSLLMQNKMLEKFEEKDVSYKDCNNLYLLNELYKHLLKGDYVDVANFAFMLWDKKRREK